MKITGKQWSLIGIAAGWILVLAFVLFPDEMWSAQENLSKRIESADPIESGARNMWEFSRWIYGF